MHAPAPLLPLLLEEVSFQAGGQRLIDGVTLRLEAGPPTVILGPNGAGKSLLLRLCHGLLQPSSGRVAWLGPAAQQRDTLRFGQAMVFQKPVLLRRSVLDNVIFPLKLRGMNRHARAERAQAALDRVGLAALAERPARVLSGGEQQRLALARAWALNPQILFLDEPTANLDPAATRQVEQIIKGFVRDGTKIVMTTHDLGQAKRLASDIVFLHRGRITERTPADIFFTAPRSDEAGAFLNGDLTW
ncbi:ATP-binding cassette domain-containing protein [uncultured Ferrovibrio sp.]|jgi:tungstate transport system ATP-binding protein|uniref:ATP-binding cassette domain-containing protein n=1 Tax=uncultured Ferrovibrio sp. TaxID=1576913 RepID=UPI002618CBE0|nr:ATP-binding cassette domain-containing protein [uncultured Ferrovibrio sp.]